MIVEVIYIYLFSTFFILNLDKPRFLVLLAVNFALFK